MGHEMAQIIQNLNTLTTEFAKLTPAINEIAPDLPRTTKRAVEALDETVVLLKAMQRSWLLRGNVKDVKDEEEKIASRHRSEAGMSSGQAVFPRSFDAKSLGSGMKEVASNLLRVESSDLVGRWFHSPAEVDLFLWTDNSRKLVKQQLTFYGQVVEWNSVEGTKTGVVSENENGLNPGVKSSETIRFDSGVQPQPLGLAMDVIRHAAALTPEEQREIISNFFRGQRISSRHPADFLELYGSFKVPPYHRLANFLAHTKRLLRRLFRPT